MFVRHSLEAMLNSDKGPALNDDPIRFKAPADKSETYALFSGPSVIAARWEPIEYVDQLVKFTAIEVFVDRPAGGRSHRPAAWVSLSRRRPQRRLGHRGETRSTPGNPRGFTQTHDISVVGCAVG